MGHNFLIFKSWRVFNGVVHKSFLQHVLQEEKGKRRRIFINEARNLVAEQRQCTGRFPNVCWTYSGCSGKSRPGKAAGAGLRSGLTVIRQVWVRHDVRTSLVITTLPFEQEWLWLLGGAFIYFPHYPHYRSNGARRGASAEATTGKFQLEEWDMDSKPWGSNCSVPSYLRILEYLNYMNIKLNDFFFLN